MPGRSASTHATRRRRCSRACSGSSCGNDSRTFSPPGGAARGAPFPQAWRPTRARCRWRRSRSSSTAGRKPRVPADRRRLAPWLEAAAVAVVAALYFAGAIGTTIDWTDEGHIVYPSWRAGAGVLPYVGFHQLYGPSLFLLNGALFRVLGPDLRVLRT